MKSTQSSRKTEVLANGAHVENFALAALAAELDVSGGNTMLLLRVPMRGSGDGRGGEFGARGGGGGGGHGTPS